MNDLTEAQRYLTSFMEGVGAMNGVLNSLAVRRFLAIEANRAEEEEKEAPVGTQEDYFGMNSLSFSELESHHESLHDSPNTAAILPQYFN